MGTKVQSKTCYPGQHSMMDMNNNVYSGMWDLYREDKTMENSQYSFFTRPAIDGYASNEKEQLRQTVLKQESMFRHQLQELHRLYKRQKDLMYECKREELHHHPMLEGASKVGLSASQVPSEDAQEKRDVSNILSLDSNFGRLSTSGSIQSPLASGNRESTGMDCKLLKSNLNASQKRKFDLELAADLYMHNEGVQQVDRIHDSGLADLNEPIQVEEVSLLTSGNNLCNNGRLKEELQRRDVCMNSNSGLWFSPMEFSQNFIAKRQAGICLDDNKLKDSERNINWQSTYNLNAGPTRLNDSTHSTYPDYSSPLSKPVQVEPRKALEHIAFPATDRSKPESRWKKKIFGVEICEDRPQQFSNASQTPRLHLSNPRFDVAKCESSFDMPWRKTPVLSGQKFLALQEDDHSHGYFVLSSRNMASVGQLSDFFNNSSKSAPSSSGELQTDSSHGFRTYCKQVEGYSSTGFCFSRAINSQDIGVERVGKLHHTENSKGSEGLNSITVGHSKQGHDIVAPHYNSMSADWQKQENRERGLPWLMANPKSCLELIKGKENIYQMNLDTLQNHSQQFFRKPEMKKGPAQEFTQESTSVAYAHDSKLGKVDADHCLSVTKILGFPIVDVSNMSNSPSCLSMSIDCNSNADDKIFGKEQHEIMGLVKENGVNNDTSGLRHEIDLNLSLNEEEPPVAPLQKTILQIATTEVDIEAPAVLESEVDISREAEANLPLDCSRDPHEQLAKAAAEAIVTISTASPDVADSSYQSLEASASGLLLWFADIISSDNVHEGLVEVDDVFDEESIPEGMDYFEFMTLRLKDTKEEEYCCKPMILEEENDVPTSLAKRPRKGQRRGRQRKDFQRDILPSLVSLSRRDVAEDLQTFEDVFTAIGDTWQSSMSKRKAARTGRGRRRLVEPDPSPIAIAVSTPLINQPVCREVALVEKSLSGWGKRTRRLPRQRCTSGGNHPLALKC